MSNLVRAPTGIPELDDMVRGGFLRGDVALVAGSVGTGKTTLGLQFLVNGATRYGEPGLYVSFEEMPDQIYRDAYTMGWDLRKLEDEDKVRVICTSPDLLLKGIDLLDESLQEIRARRVVLDTVTHLQMFVPETEIRKELYRIVRYLKTKGVNALLLHEIPKITGEAFAISEVGIGFLVDAILLLKHVEIGSAIHKAITILKMRGSDHDKQLREFEITSAGIKVAAPFSEYEGIITGSPRRRTPERFVELFSKAARKGK